LRLPIAEQFRAPVGLPISGVQWAMSRIMRR
jgi:hypothetical protein